MQEHAKKPAIRFKGFTDDWEQRKLGEIAETFSGGTPTVGVKEYYNGEIPFIRSAEINSDTTELHISIEGLKKSSARCIEKGDILYALYGATSGEVGIAKFNGAINQAILAIKSGSGYYSEYIAQWLKHNKKYIVDTYLQGGQGNLSAAIVKDLPINFPCTKEQINIGNLLKHFDRLITLHQRKHDKLVNIKKAMLEKMFPQDGAKVPEIRFKGFTDDWEQRKAESIGYYTKGNGYSKADLASEGIPIILYGRLYTDYSFYIDRVDTFVEEIKACVYSEGNEVIVPASGETAEDIARASAVLLKGILLGGDLNILNLSEEHDSKFIALLLSNGSAKKELSKCAQGKSVVHIHNSDIQKLLLAIPSRAEQCKIADLFTSLDRLITLHQRKLEKLQNIKRACLEKLFV